MSGKTYKSYALDLLVYLAHRDRIHLSKFIKPDYVPEEIQAALEFLPAYFDRVAVDVPDWEGFAEMHRILRGEEPPAELIEALVKYPVGAEPDAGILNDFLDMHYAEEAISLAAEHAARGRSTPFGADLQRLLDGHSYHAAMLGRTVESPPTSDIGDALVDRTGGLSWPLPCLQTMLGPSSNDFIIVASRPDGGKTTFLAQCAVHAARTLPAEKQVLWFNNEEHITKVKRRIICNALSASWDELEGHEWEDVATAYLGAVGANRIIFIDDANHAGKIERIIRSHNPGLIILDQLYKIRATGVGGGKNEVEAERFRQLCEWARNLGKAHCTVLASNQLDGSAEGEPYPTMNHLYGSKTGAQGEADAIIMIGRDFASPGVRFISTPKNKLTGKNWEHRIGLDAERATYYELP